MSKELFLFLFVFSIYQIQAQKPTTKKPTQSELNGWIAKAKRDTEIAIGSSKDKPGFGNSTEPPDGTELKLPPGLKIVKCNSKKFNPDVKLLAGGTVDAFYVEVCFVYCPPDTTSGIRHVPKIELPPGWMLTSDVGSGQTGILVENVFFTVPYGILEAPKDSACSDTLSIYLAVACMNEKRDNIGMNKIHDKDANSDYLDAVGLYSPGKVTNDPNLLKLLAIISDVPKLRVTKHRSRLALLAREDESLQEKGIKPYVDTPEDKVRNKIQQAIWKVTDGRGITHGELEELKKALAPYKKRP